MKTANFAEKNEVRPEPLSPGQDALLVLLKPALAVRAVHVSRVWRSFAGTERVEVSDPKFRPRASFDRRQFIALRALENLGTGAQPFVTAKNHKNESSSEINSTRGSRPPL